MTNRELWAGMLERRIDGLQAQHRRMIRNVRAYHESGRRPSAAERRECRRHFRILAGQLRIALRDLERLEEP